MSEMFLTSKILKSKHAFSTREGGVSALEHTKGLNLAFGRGDAPEVVLKNLEIFGAAAGFEPKNVISLPQIHSNIIYKVGRRDAGEGYYKLENLSEGDGYVTNDTDVCLGVKSADCVPVLFEGRRDGEVVCIGATHAGWRGSVARIAPLCAEKMCAEYGVSLKDIFVAIGPCIHKCCFEVGEDFLCEFYEKLGKDFGTQFIFPSQKEGKYYCDLVSLNKALLVESGIPEQNIEIIDRCTCCEPDVFYSHRYSKGQRGTMLSVIWM